MLGRKLVVFASIVLLGILSVIGSLVQSIIQMMVIRFFSGVLYCVGNRERLRLDSRQN